MLMSICCILVARYCRASLTVTNTHVGGQPAEVRGTRRRLPNNSAYGILLPPCPFHLPCSSYCDVAQAQRYFASSIQSYSFSHVASLGLLYSSFKLLSHIKFHSYCNPVAVCLKIKLCSFILYIIMCFRCSLHFCVSE
jgi:hypothetical protein